MVSETPRWSADVRPAEWIAPRLSRELGTVASVVPGGFPAYARVLHPADEDVRWEQVAADTGRLVHPLVQWHRLVGSDDPVNADGADWPGGAPRTGELEPVSLAALLAVLRRHTSTPRACWYCLWEGWGWLRGSPSVAVLGSAEPVPPAFPAEVLDGPRVRHPLGRDHLLFSGPLESVLELGHHTRPDWFIPQSPQLLWPDDRAWCVGTEIDFDSTLVAGTAELVDDLLTADGLEVWPVRPGDSLRADGDLLN